MTHPIFRRAELFRECARNHWKNGDREGFDALMCAAVNGPNVAMSRFPFALDAIRNARAFVEQEMGAGAAK